MLISGLFIELTSECNLRCPYCYNNSSSQNIMLNDFPTIKNFIAHCGLPSNMSVSLSGGEPYLYPYFNELLDWLLSNHYEVTVITNGGLIAHDLPSFKKLLKHNVYFQLTLDSHIESVHDMTRGKHNYNNCMQAISEAKAYVHSNIKIRHNISYANYEHIEQFIIFAANLGIKKISFSVLDKVGRGVNFLSKTPISMPQLISTAYSVLEMLELKYTDLDLEYRGIIDNSICALCTLNEGDAHLLKVNYCGDVLPCQSFYEKRHSLGNINFDPFDNILSTAKLKEVMTPINENRISICKKCVFQKDSCLKCPALFTHSSKSDVCTAKLMLHKAQIFNGFLHER